MFILNKTSAHGGMVGCWLGSTASIENKLTGNLLTHSCVINWIIQYILQFKGIMICMKQSCIIAHRCSFANRLQINIFGDSKKRIWRKMVLSNWLLFIKRMHRAIKIGYLWGYERLTGEFFAQRCVEREVVIYGFQSDVLMLNLLENRYLANTRESLLRISSRLVLGAVWSSTKNPSARTRWKIWSAIRQDATSLWHSTSHQSTHIWRFHTCKNIWEGW